MTWWRRRTLRARLLWIGVAGLCVGLLLGGIMLVAALGYVLQRSVDNEVQRTAAEVAALVDQDALPNPLPVGGADLVQVVDSSGRVRASSLDADRLVPMLHPDELAQARSGRPLFVDGDRLGIIGPVRVVALPAGSAADPQTVLVGRSMADVLKGIQLLRTVLLIGFPLLVGVLALVAWRVIGATLRPVEELRRGAEAIAADPAAGNAPVRPDPDCDRGPFGRGSHWGHGAPPPVRPARPGRLPVAAGDDEIHLLAVTLNGMLDRLEAARSRQREFVADAAHELRSPLTNMRTQLEVAQRLGPDAPWPTIADELLTDTNRLARLVDDLLLLARTDSSAGLARPIPVDLAVLLAEVASRYPTVTVPAVSTTAASTTAVSPSAVSTVDGPLWVAGDPDGLRRVVANLLDNAVRHGSSTVTVDARAVGDRVVLAITDDGPGIPAADRDRVFERFTRLDDARARNDGGSGLGLAIVRELVRRHHGHVRLLDAPPTLFAGAARADDGGGAAGGGTAGGVAAGGGTGGGGTGGGGTAGGGTGGGGGAADGGGAAGVGAGVGGVGRVNGAGGHGPGLRVEVDLPALPGNQPTVA